jgi:isoquinoline 1-oxidoreductase subunit alpha
MPAYVLTVNGSKHTVTVAEDTPLLWVLRDQLELTGTKFGCGIGQCGACTVSLAGTPTRSCKTTVSEVAGAPIVTIEGLAATPVGKRLQQAWIAEQVPQCGYCQSGQLISAAGLLTDKSHPSDADIDEAMSGNICRCATYVRIRRAIHRAAGEAK